MATPELPRAGDTWKHYLGGMYRVIGVARLESDASTWMVVYQRINIDALGQDKLWVRPLESWMEVKPSGEKKFEIQHREPTPPSTLEWDYS